MANDAAPQQSPPAPPPPHLPRKGIQKWVIALIAFTIVGGLATVAVVLATLLPTDLEPLRSQYAPFVERSGRVLDKPGCGLTEVAAADGCKAAEPSGVDEVEVTFPSRLKDKYLPTLKGTLSIPKGLDGKRPAVLLIHGSGPNSRDSPAPGDILRPNRPSPFYVFKTLAGILSRQGLVVLRYDKRACAKCYPEAYKDKKIDWSMFRFHDFVDDARDGLELLQSRPEVDPKALVVIGISQGGKLAPHVAHESEGVAAVVSLSGTTQSMADGLSEQLERIAAIRQAQWDYLGAWGIRSQNDKIAACVDKLKGDYDPADMCLGGGVTLAALAAEKQMADKTIERLASLPCPLLVLHGALDRNVPPNIARGVADAVKGRDAEVHLIADLGHLLTNLIEPSDPQQFDPAVVEALNAFLRSVKLPANND